MPLKSLENSNGVKNTSSHHDYPGKPMTEIITNGFFAVDRRWTVTFWNKAAEKLLGVKAEDILGRNIWEKFTGVIPMKFYKAYHKTSLQDIPSHFEEYWGEMGAWFDVTTYYLDDTLSVSFKSDDELIHKKHPEEQLKILNELYRYVTEVTNDCLWEWDLQARQLFWIDGGHKRVFGYPIVNALIPQSFWESLLHPDDKERILTRLNKIIADKSSTVWEDEYRFAKLSGEYAYVHDRAHIIYSEDKKSCRMIGATQDITARKSAEIQLLESERKLTQERLTKQKEIVGAVLTALENERASIGKELHDNLNQILGATKLYIDLAKIDEENSTMLLEKSSGYIVDVIEQIRKISKTLAVPAMNIMGLLESIKMLLDDLIIIHPIKIEFHEEGVKEEELDKNLKLDIFRIVQEQLNNIIKHSGATHATIALNKQDKQIILLIADNGQGHDILKETNGVGITNIKSRAVLHHGNATIQSKPGEGYELRVVLCLPPFVS